MLPVPIMDNKSGNAKSSWRGQGPKKAQASKIGGAAISAIHFSVHAKKGEPWHHANRAS